MTDYLLRVFRISIPHMPKTAVKFGQELQLVLQPMIVKPSNVGGVVVGWADKSNRACLIFYQVPTRKRCVHVWSCTASHT